MATKWIGMECIKYMLAKVHGNDSKLYYLVVFETCSWLRSCVQMHMALYACCFIFGHNLCKIDWLIEPCSWASFIACFHFAHIVSWDTMWYPVAPTCHRRKRFLFSDILTDCVPRKEIIFCFVLLLKELTSAMCWSLSICLPIEFLQQLFLSFEGPCWVQPMILHVVCANACRCKVKCNPH